MVDDDFFDGFLTGGFLPGMRDVVLRSVDESTTEVTLEARQEPITEQQMALAGIEAGTESVVYFFPVDQPNYVRPRSRWTIEDGKDGSAWVIVKDDLTIQARGVAVAATRDRR